MADLHQAEDIIGSKYRILNCIAEGAFGTTYEAEEIHTYQRVAIKAVSLRQVTDWKVLELLEREARILASLDHPFIPNYVDYFQIDSESDRRFYLVQELVSGRSLAELVESGWHTTEEEVKEIALQVLNILEYLHELTPPVIHRDIKPQNIIRRPDGQVYLVDFGAVQDVYRNTIAKSGTFVGTVGYMPAEQYTGKAFFSSDLYALGATLLFLLTHRSPADLPEKRLKIDFRDRINVSPELAEWLDKILEPAVEDRFPSVAEAKAALDMSQINLPNLANSESKSASNGAIESSIETPVLLTHRQPKGSRIEILRTTKRLCIEVPKILFRDYYLSLGLAQAVVGVLLSPFIFMFFYIFLEAWFGIPVSYIWLLLSIAVTVIFIVVFNLLKQPYIEVTDTNFKFYLKIFNWVVWKIEKSLELFRYIKCTEEDSQSGGQIYLCIAVFKKNDSSGQVKIAKCLNPVDRNWLVSELSDFIHRAKDTRE